MLHCRVGNSCLVFKREKVRLASVRESAEQAVVREQALATFGDEVAIAWSGAEDVALVEYAHLTGRPYRVFRYASSNQEPAQIKHHNFQQVSGVRGIAGAVIAPCCDINVFAWWRDAVWTPGD